MPEAYSLVRKYKTVRPGFLILDTEGDKWGSVALSSVEPEKSGREALEYLRQARTSKAPLPDRHEYPESDPSLLTGTFQLLTVEKGSAAEQAGFEPGDLLIRLNGKTVERFLDLAVANPGGDACFFEVDRNGEIVKISFAGELKGLSWSFQAKLPADL